MRKRIILIVFLFLLFPISVNAEFCKVTKGTGQDIGDEVQCGTESFYLVSNQEDRIELLAKYNLFVGDIINYFDIEGERPIYNNNSSSNITLAMNYCMERSLEKGYNPYVSYPVYGEWVETGNEVLGCRVYEKIEADHIRQDERAVGTKLDGTGHSILPLYGITYMQPEWGYEAIHNHVSATNVYDNDGNLILEGSSFKQYIDGYKEELEEQEIEVEKVSFITLDRTLELLKNISNQNVEIELDYPDEATYTGEFYYGKMDIKDYIGNNSWIYDVTYWLGSGFINENNVVFYYNDFYISNEGMLCAIGRGECQYLPYPIGNGVRPLVTIQKGNVLYDIKVETDGNGTIEAPEKAYGNDFIRFKVVPKPGYKLNKLTVITDSGETVEYTEESFIENPDGTTSVDSSVFTMPFENVTIRASWRMDVVPTPTPTSTPAPYEGDVTVPDTYTVSITALFFIIITGASMVYYIKKEKNQ